MVMIKFAENFRNTDEISLKPQLCENQTKQVSNKSLTKTCKANQGGENSPFIFTVSVKSVPRHHFKLAYVSLQMVVKECFETQF